MAVPVHVRYKKQKAAVTGRGFAKIQEDAPLSYAGINRIRFKGFELYAHLSSWLLVKRENPFRAGDKLP